MSDRKILIVDDESLARERIRRFLSDLRIPAQIIEATNGLDALEKIKSLKPDLVFLDIQMPGLTGFEVLQQLEDRTFQLIFQTAFDEYAIQAFEQNACDYLLKPFDRDRFEKALKKALNLQEQEIALKNLEQGLQKQQGFLDRLAVKKAGKTQIIEIQTIDCFISRDHYTCLYSKGSELIVELSLNWLEEKLNPQHFIRCHRNNIVAISQIKSVGSTEDSEINLKNGMKVDLSRNNRKKVLDLFLS